MDPVNPPLPPSPPCTTGIEHVACNLCGADDAGTHLRAPVKPHRRGVYARDVWEVVRCRSCGLIYVNPRIDAEARAALYSYRTPAERELIRSWFFDNADLQRPLWRRLLRVLARECPAGKLLDVGCGSGGFLAECRSRGYEAAGQEISPWFAEHCREHHGLTVHEGFLEDLDLPRGGFDAVTAFDVIEHHPDPTALVTRMRALLRPGGVALLTTHDIGNLFARLYGARWRYLSPASHITYFTRPTLSRLLREHGFGILRVGGIHTIDDRWWRTLSNACLAFWRVIVLRSVIIGVYGPLARRWPALTRWRIALPSGTLDHPKLMQRAGSQIVINDDMVILARAV